MNIVKTIIGKLEYSLTLEEEVHFRNWMDDLPTNKLMFLRLEGLKNIGIDFSKVMDLDVQFAWENVGRRLE